MKNYKKVLAGLCALSCLAVLTACGNKTEKVLELIDSGDFSGALDYYEDEIEGSNKERDQRKEIKNELEDRYEDILEKIDKDEIDEDNLEDFFELIDELKIDTDDEDYEEFYSDYRMIEMSKENFDTGEEYFDNGDYTDAIYYFELIEEDDSRYEKAQEKIAEAEEKIAEEKLSEIQSYIDSEDYDEAIDLLEYYEEDIAESEDYDRLLSEAESGIIANVKENIDEYFADYYYSDAYYYVSDMTYYYPDIEEIQVMFDELEDNYVALIETEVDALVADEDYEGALDLLDFAIDETWYDNDTLIDLYDTIYLLGEDVANQETASDAFIPGAYFGMTEDDVIAMMGQPDSISEFGEYDYWTDGSNDVKIEYIYNYDNGIADLGIDKPSYMFFEFKAGVLSAYGIHVGTQVSSSGEWSYVCTEEELAAEYGKLLEMLTDKYGAGIEMDIAETGMEQAGYRAEYDWYDTQHGNIWFIYGMSLWGDDTGINELILSFTDPTVYPS